MVSMSILIFSTIGQTGYACSLNPMSAYSVLQSGEAVDVSPPSTPLHLSTTVSRGYAPCAHQDDTSTSCDMSYLGTIYLLFANAWDDVDRTDVGYRVIVASGTPPQGFEDWFPSYLVTPWADSEGDLLTLNWDDDWVAVQEGFDFRLAVTAIDRSGNESDAIEVWLKRTVTIQPPCPPATGSGCATAAMPFQRALGLVVFAVLVAFRRRG